MSGKGNKPRPPRLKLLDALRTSVSVGARRCVDCGGQVSELVHGSPAHVLTVARAVLAGRLGKITELVCAECRAKRTDNAKEVST